MSALPPVCILAGGRGTRLGGLVRDTPKPLIEVAGEPFLVHQLRSLAAHGLREAILCVGYRAEAIEARLGESCCAIAIRYSRDAPGLEGTLGAIRKALPLLGERFLVLYGDSYLRIDYGAAFAGWSASGLPAMMCVYRNEQRLDTSNSLYADGRVLAYDKRAPRAEMEWIDYGLGGLTRGALELAPERSCDLSDLYSLLARQKKLYGFPAGERFYEIGTPAALRETESFLRGVDAG
ncbi:MAG TPA: NTP transferase domain-containing protein [Solirubrobacteraceae bacterium]|nr:NTP transferase domain-containing protein [Solirubrobacteraceae bacterium]